jgi:hypothetical protein
LNICASCLVKVTHWLAHEESVRTRHESGKCWMLLLLVWYERGLADDVFLRDNFCCNLSCNRMFTSRRSFLGAQAPLVSIVNTDIKAPPATQSSVAKDATPKKHKTKGSSKESVYYH